MTVPWRSQPKTWRDQLYDLGFGVTKILASSPEDNHAFNEKDPIGAQITGLLRIETGITTWKSSWLAQEYPHLIVRCDCPFPDILSCICSLPASEFPNYDFTLLQVECWALQLLISAALRKLLAVSPELSGIWSANLFARSEQIAVSLDSALKVPVFQRTSELSSAVTEGICRMVFPTWILKEYRGSPMAIDSDRQFQDVSGV
jgi:hypothetical protein